MRSQALKPPERGSSGWGLASELYLASGTLEVRCVSLEGKTSNKLVRRGTQALTRSFSAGVRSPYPAAQSALV